jgi:hypothetical protein
MYRVRFNVQFRVNKGVQALRFFLATTNSKFILADAKD